MLWVGKIRLVIYFRLVKEGCDNPHKSFVVRKNLRPASTVSQLLFQNLLAYDPQTL